jgi:predicted 2-oxoglutarate/Fe(II)-dependent dioxygenase YbiX
MSAMSNFLENKLIDRIFRGQEYTFPTTLYVGLFNASPADVGGGVEVVGNDYARSAVDTTLANWAGTQSAGSAAASNGTSATTSNNNAITFPTPTGSWDVVTAFGIFDAASGGNLLFYGNLTISKTINPGDLVTFPAASLSLQLDN